MITIVKENLFIMLATIFLGIALAFTFTANAQTTGDCRACGGNFGSGDCYNVSSGASICTPIGDDCSQAGSCENGDHQFDEP